MYTVGPLGEIVSYEMHPERRVIITSDLAIHPPRLIHLYRLYQKLKWSWSKVWVELTIVLKFTQHQL